MAKWIKNEIEKFMGFSFRFSFWVPYGGPFAMAEEKKITRKWREKKGIENNRGVGWVREKSNYHVIGKSSWNFNELYLRLKRMLWGGVGEEYFTQTHFLHLKDSNRRGGKCCALMLFSNRKPCYFRSNFNYEFKHTHRR